MKPCQECGQQIPDTAKVCGYCGTRQPPQELRAPEQLDEAEATQVAADSAGHQRGGRRRTIGLLVVVAAIAGAAFLVTEQPRSSDALPVNTAGASTTAISTGGEQLPAPEPTPEGIAADSVFPPSGVLRSHELDGSQFFLLFEPGQSAGLRRVTVYDTFSNECDPVSPPAATLSDQGVLMNNKYGDLVLAFGGSAEWTCLFDGGLQPEPKPQFHPEFHLYKLSSFWSDGISGRRFTPVDCSEVPTDPALSGLNCG